MPLKIKLTPAYKKDLERFAQADGQQRGVFFDTSGNMRSERVCATSTALWVFKTKSGKPFKWNNGN